MPIDDLGWQKRGRSEYRALADLYVVEQHATVLRYRKWVMASVGEDPARRARTAE